MSDVVLRKRYGNQWFRINQLIQPHDYMVDRLMQSLPRRTVHGYWDWVIAHIQYPWGQLAWSDTHAMQAFWLPGLLGRRVRLRYSQPDFWSMPGEVLRDRVGDCKDGAVLVTSMLRHVLTETQVYMSVGWYTDAHQHHLHAWTTIFLPDGTPLALDTTYPHPLTPGQWVRESPHYRPFWRANDRRTLVLDAKAAQRAYGPNLRITQASAHVFETDYAQA